MSLDQIKTRDRVVLRGTEQIALAAGQLLLQRQGSAIESQKDSSHNLVTEADLESETLICDRLKSLLPSAAFLREEGPSTGDESSAEVWIVDPLDGTNNYAHGIPQFSVSIALVRDGVFEMGVVYDPNREELFSAWRGAGAYLNQRPISVSRRPTLQQSIVCTGFYYDRGELVQKTLGAIDRLFAANVQGIRRLGSAALDLCWIACGRLDGYFEYQLGTWDYAAGALIVDQAGGRCSDRNGNPMTVSAGNVIASNGLIHHDLVDVVRWEGPRTPGSNS